MERNWKRFTNFMDEGYISNDGIVISRDISISLTGNYRTAGYYCKALKEIGKASYYRTLSGIKEAIENNIPFCYRRPQC